ncbi:MAG: 6-phospho-beta-glucosidase [Ilumatobacteraceae bacterium]
MKIAVVGGGSTYTPELVDGISRLRNTVDVDQLILCDPDTPRLDVVAGVSQRIADRHGWPGMLTSTPHIDEAVDGADFVLLQLRIGGQAARHQDETLPLRCGCVGQETTGAGGFAKALRTVPVVLDIAAEVRRRAPDAWIIDFTNPVGIVTRALLDNGHRAMGLCNVAIGFQRLFASWLGVAPDEVLLGHAGLNHLTWIRSVDVGRTNVLPAIIEEHGQQLADRVGMPLRLLHTLGAVPSYYLRYFYQHDVVVAEQRDQERTRAEEVMQIEEELLEIYRDPNVDSKPELLVGRGGAFYSEAAVQLVRSLWTDGGDVQVVDVRNNGALPELPHDAIVEIPCTINRYGATPAVTAGLHRATSGLSNAVASYERLAAEAAVTGDKETAFLALLAHPLIAQIKPAEQLLDDLLRVNAAHLPQFRS